MPIFFRPLGLSTSGLRSTALLLLACGLLKAQVTTTTTLTSVTPAAPQFGQTVTLTATVAPAAATGSVSFMDSGMLVGVGTLASGSATLRTLTLPAGPHALKAVYGGVIGAYQASQSAVQPYVVTALADSLLFVAGTYGVGATAQFVAVGDFNGDGKADLAAANYSGNTVSIYLGNGNGTFTQASGSPITVGTNPASLAIGDFNGDGKADLVVANYNGSNLSILLGNGSGGFSPASGSPYQIANPWAAAVGDFNGDGRADLAVTNHLNNTVTILLGNGSGGFSPSGSPIAVGTQPVSVAVSDFNRDGIPDLAVANNGSNSVTILLGNGSGGFSPSGSPFGTGTNPYAVIVADFNGDGNPDLAVSNPASNNVTVLLGNGSAGFSPASGSPFAAGTQPYYLTVGDFNGDGKADLALPDSGPGNVTVLLGNGNGGFSAAGWSPVNIGASASPIAAAAGDFNGDGRPDLAVANYNAGTLSILLGTVPPASTTTLLSGPNPSQFGQSVTLTASVTPASTGPVEFLDGTTLLGVGTLSSGSAHLTTPLLPSGGNSLRALYNGSPGSLLPSESGATSQTMNPVGGLGFAPAVTYPAQQSEPEYLAVGDFNLDGKPDVAVADNSGWISVFLGNGNGTFQTVHNFLDGGANSLAVADFNGDGKPDLVATTGFANNVAILLGNGDGTFQAAVSYPAGLAAVSLVVADFNGDGWADVASGVVYSTSSGNTTGHVSIMLGNGDGTLRAPMIFGPAVGGGAYGMAVGDVNGDGKPDLLAAQFGSTNVSLFLGNGDGTLQPVVNLPVGNKPLFVAVGDFNADGKQDLAAVNNNGANMSILLGNGDGTFQPAVNYGIGSQPYSVAVGDFNADGKQDLATGNYAGNNVSVLLGNGNGTFQPAVNYPGGGTETLSVAVADLNGDGRADLVFSNYNSNNIGVLLATPAPIISSISPSTVSAAETVTLTVNGSNFLSTSVPYWNTAPNVGPLPNVQFAGSTLLSATVPASYIPAGGSYPVSVATPDGGLSIFTASLPLTVGSCSYALTPPSATIPSTAGPYSVSLTATCPYSTVINGSWISITSGATGTGTGTIGYSVLANTTGSQRSGSISVLDAGGDLAAVYTITQQTPPCSSLTITSGSFTYSSAANNGTVTLSSGCPWSAVSSSPSFLTLPSSTGTGSSIAFHVTQNSGGQRSATITVTNTTTGSVFPAVNIVQNGVVCTYSIADTTSGATSNGFSSSGGSGSLNVTAPSGCNWNATMPSGSFVSLSSSASGSGTGPVTYSLPSGSAARSSSITITGQVAGQTYTGQVYNITQASPSTTANCVANGGAPPIARAEGATELVGDIVITCASGSAPAPGINGDVTVYFSSNGVNVPPTNQLIGSGSFTDALLLINEPSTPVLNTNAFRGEVTPVPAMTGRPAGFVLLFPSVQLTPVAGGSFTNLTLRITNLRLNASTPGASSSITAAATLPPPFACGCATQTVGFIAQGLPGENTPASMGLASQTSANFTVNFGEGYASAFRPRLATGQDPSQPGGVYNAESGFVNSAALGTQTGFATTGTRLQATLTNVPAGVTIYAPAAPVSGSNAGLVAANATCNGTSFCTGSQAIAISAGTGAATWEVTASNSSVIETFGFSISISNPGGVNLSNMKYQISLAPAIGLGGTSATLPIPRFAVAGTQPALANLSLAPTAGSLAGSLLAISHLGNAAAIQKSLALAASSTIGGSVTVSELVANDSGNPASNVVVGGSLPTSWTVAGCVAPDASGSCTMSGNQFTVTYPTLSPGQTATILFTGQTLTQGLSTLSFNSIVSSDTSDGSSQGSFTVTFPVPAFTIQKTHASNFTQGGTGAYSISVVNSATTSTSGQVTVTDTIPSGLTITGMSDGGAGVWTCTVSTATCTTSQTLAPTLGYPPITVTVNVSPTAPSNVINTATVSGGGSQSPATALDSTNINPACSYQLNPTGASVGSGASNSSVGVTALFGCQWTATSNAPWLTVTSGSPGNGNGTVNYSVAANPSGSGTRSGALTIGGQTFTVNQAANLVAPTMTLSQTTLYFGSGGGVITGQQFVTVSFSGSAAVAWTASSSQPNVTVSPASGTGLGMLTITASAGPSATITVTAPGASNSPLAIQANVATVTSGIPFGSFDTPSNGATGLAGSIVVTGWALDSIGVTGVDIWREPVAGEPASPSLILVGNATFVAGARPDVQALYPTTPFNYQAGWGYLLLSNELKNSGVAGGIGNGTYNIHAIAHNQSGSSLDLGTKTITVNNAAATLPFGAIDTPGQGATVSGTLTNFGWALTAPATGCPLADLPCIIPVNGSTIFVYVDGQSLGSPIYNLARCDVDTLFPGYANSGSTNCALNGTSPGPVGYFNLNTTQLTNGVHTIAWSVTDNAGKSQGIGSRYFTVEN